VTAEARQSIREVAQGIRSGSLSAVEVMTRCLDASDRLAGPLNAFASRNSRDRLMSQAIDVDRRRKNGDALRPLDGIPIAVKDVFFTTDLPTTASSKAFAGFHPGEDGFAVGKLRAAGALVVGKSQTHELAYGPTTANEYAGPSRNPWNLAHVPGGSSGGSAIAVATGMCLGATGSDTGGSIRTPSAFCGVSGLKPTYGLVSRSGIFSLSWSLDHAGAIAGSADDLAFLLQAMAGFDPNDPGSVEFAVPDYVAGVGHAPRALRVGVPKEHYFDVLDPEVSQAFDASLDVLRDCGWAIDEVSIPHLEHGLGAELAILGAEAAAYHRDLMQRQAEDISNNVRRELDAGMMILATDYLLGQRVRRLIVDDFAAAFAKVDLLVTPTTPIPAPRIGRTEIEIGGKTYSALGAIWRNVYPTNLTGSPTLCVPCGFSEAGLPISLQMIGRNFAELTLLKAGHCFQSATNWHKCMPTESGS
jgi:aspartyl-tRNA(Asn)/glutamyl-tRNA(Gln) amidotransferase subunit A